MKLKAIFGYDSDAESLSTGLECKDPSLAVQAEKDEADINTILRRYKLTGQLPTGVRTPTYGDFTGIIDYATAVRAVKAADDEFMKIPAHIRQAVGNNPQGLLEFIADPKNKAQLVEWGLAEAPSAPPQASEAP